MEYKEKLEEAKKLYKSANGDQKRVLESLFPEVKESENEYIRKRLLHIANVWKEGGYACGNDDEIDDIIAWLEKQGHTDRLIERVKTEKQRVIITETDGNANIDWDTRSLKDARKLLERGLQYIDAELEKQGEKKSKDRYTFNSIPRLLDMIEPTDRAKSYCQKLIDSLSQEGYTTDAKIVSNCLKRMNGEKVAMATMDGQKPVKVMKSPEESLGISSKEYNDIVNDCLYGEQKPADKVESKFKVGDWIVFNGLTLYINEVVQGYYRTISIGGIPNSYDWDIDNIARLWTIQDAKEGDVLYHSDTASNGIFIFKELLKYEFGEKVICYCDYDSEDHFCLGEHHTCCWADAKILHPATKEQRDTLFSKIKEAGYVFDFDKKELRKITSPADVGFEELGKTWTKENKKKSADWGKEDAVRLQRIIDFLWYNRKGDTDTIYQQEQDIDWLKSLGQRMGG